MVASSDPLKMAHATIESLMLENSSAAIAVIEPLENGINNLLDFQVCFNNPAFDKYSGSKNASVLDSRGARSLLLQAWRENCHQSAAIRHQTEEKSLVVNISVNPVAEKLVITIIDVTSLSHGREMLELQTTLMDENSRALEVIKASLEAEISRRGELENKLRKLADTDALSGLANRRSFMERAASEFRRSRRYGHQLSLVMLDLDKFKQVNDTHGHAAGDTVIMAVSQICQSLSREGVDVTGRIGGEEFAILLPETGQDGAKSFAERLRLVIETTPIFADITKIEVTASMGVATLRENDHDVASALKRADDALYKSKNAGRNMVSAG